MDESVARPERKRGKIQGKAYADHRLLKRGRITPVDARRVGDLVPSHLQRKALSDPAKMRELGAALAARSLLLLRDRLAATERVQGEINLEHAKPRPSWRRIYALEAAVMPTGDLLRVSDSLNDRFGQPKRSEQEISIASGITPLRLILHSDDGEEAAVATHDHGTADLVQ